MCVGTVTRVLDWFLACFRISLAGAWVGTFDSLGGLGCLLLRLGLDRTLAGMAGPWTDGLRSSGVWLLLASSTLELLLFPLSGLECENG